MSITPNQRRTEALSHVRAALKHAEALDRHHATIPALRRAIETFDRGCHECGREMYRHDEGCENFNAI